MVMIAGRIVSPTEGELIVGLMIGVAMMIGLSLAIGWVFSKFFSPPKRKAAFRSISVLVMIGLLGSCLLTWFVLLE